MDSHGSKVRRSGGVRERNLYLMPVNGFVLVAQMVSKWKFALQIERMGRFEKESRSGIAGKLNFAETKERNREAESCTTWDRSSGSGVRRGGAGPVGTKRAEKKRKSRFGRVGGEGQGSVRAEMCHVPFCRQRSEENWSGAEGDFQARNVHRKWKQSHDGIADQVD